MGSLLYYLVNFVENYSETNYILLWVALKLEEECP